MATESKSSRQALTIRTVHGDVMTVTPEMIERWARFRQQAGL
jgi:hypothetical protein